MRTPTAATPATEATIGTVESEPLLDDPPPPDCGITVGPCVGGGVVVGLPVGAAVVGSIVGSFVGDEDDGSAVGSCVAVGVSVGAGIVGIAVGSSVGLAWQSFSYHATVSSKYEAESTSVSWSPSRSALATDLAPS
eukprot:CAMPEP_0198659496 /NCGR_PEP_ID=MMETSP1467-20131203/32232_1 /TAXON_ID=1462469 /ORGANISM="unid. sp., Strain CCMP2135" /LENGTH=135 /DNA_ID=CAMNT_0044395851 /DNA_START=513 /DNA_END=916 /DNA_ORIENTATION=+